MKHIGASCNVTWLWGYLQRKHFAALNKGGLGSLKHTMAGKVQHILVELRTFLHAVDFGRSGKPIDSDLQEYFTSLTKEKLAEVIHGGARMMQVTPAPNTVLFIPSGWVCVEYSEDAAMTYGTRKAVYVKMAAAFGHVIDYMKVSKKEEKTITKMNAIHDHMKI